ncbi:hypothetical protein KVT40_003183 [Elsinoe batatas]|uniref:Oxidoreductase n=1 Tax=Elsinoe batatas TaxID=2601811 RepID=A0A8K0LBR2_9PEZI|nr:hypothetical protein KVT40_003183 [Elsinoe batatas]
MEGASHILIAHLPGEASDAEDTKKQVEHYGAKVTTFAADLRPKEKCKELVDTALKELGKVNILVLNHAYQMVQNSIEELSEDQWERTFDTNIHPFFYISKYLVPHMTRGDVILTCASVNAYVGRPDLLDYTSTKGAIVSFTRGLANMYVEQGIRVNAVAPGPVWTPLIVSTMGEPQQQAFKGPIGRPSQPSEVATWHMLRLPCQSGQFESYRAGFAPERWYSIERMSLVFGHDPQIVSVGAIQLVEK